MSAATKKKRIRETASDRITDTIVTIVLIIMGLMALYPLYFTIIASISNPAYIARGEVVLLPKKITFVAYKALLDQKRLWIGYRNSIFYTFGYTLLSLCITIPCAYALSRRNLPGNRGLFIFFTLTMYFSGGTIPVYLLMNKLKLVNTIWIMLIPEGISA